MSPSQHDCVSVSDAFVRSADFLCSEGAILKNPMFVYAVEHTASACFLGRGAILNLVDITKCRHVCVCVLNGIKLNDG